MSEINFEIICSGADLASVGRLLAFNWPLVSELGVVEVSKHLRGDGTCMPEMKPMSNIVH